MGSLIAWCRALIEEYQDERCRELDAIQECYYGDELWAERDCTNLITLRSSRAAGHTGFCSKECQRRDAMEAHPM